MNTVHTVVLLLALGKDVESREPFAWDGVTMFRILTFGSTVEANLFVLDTSDALSTLQKQSFPRNCKRIYWSRLVATHSGTFLSYWKVGK